jgi:hypothetical protein
MAHNNRTGHKDPSHNLAKFGRIQSDKVDDMEIVKEPYLARLRTEASELKRLIDGEPNDLVVTQAWASVGKIKEALAQLCPNHPAVMQHLR